MKRNHWTFLYVPSGEGGVRTLHVDKRLAYAIGGAVAVFLVLVGLVTSGYLHQSVVIEDVAQHERRVRALRGKISELEESVENYEAVMAKNRELQERANFLAGLGPLEGSAFGTVGLGGQEPSEDSDLVLMDELSRERLRELRVQMDKLLREARFQRDGYEQVLEILREDQQLRDCTPSIRPVVGGYLSSRFGRRIDPFTGKPAFHRGLDFSAPVGSAILAPASGRVKRAGRRGSLGNLIEIDHGNGIVTRYGHLSEIMVEKGDWVNRGQMIGRVGNTGRSTAPHLHYEVLRGGHWENPWLYIVRD